MRSAVRDDVVTMFCKRMAAIHKKGREQLEALRERHRAESERLLGVFGDVLEGVREALTSESEQTDGDNIGAAANAPEAAGDDGQAAVAERAGRLVLKALQQGGGVEALAAAHEAVSAHHGNNYFRCWISTTARTARPCSPWWTRSSRSRPTPTGVSWRLWSTYRPSVVPAPRSSPSRSRWSETARTASR
ncbi:hypothetical protein ABZ917_23445 [Nonomuraea wenchangensis]